MGFLDAPSLSPMISLVGDNGGTSGTRLASLPEAVISPDHVPAHVLRPLGHPRLHLEVMIIFLVSLTMLEQIHWIYVLDI